VAVHLAGGEASAAEKPGWPHPSAGKDRRQAIIEAARAIAAKKGFAAVTLDAVAESMGLASAAVCDCFASRQDLLEQLSLDDPSDGNPAAERHPADTIGRQGKNAAAKAEKPAGSEGGVVVAAGEFGDMMRMQAEELGKLAERIIVPKSQQREGTDAVLARLEARMHVLEQSYAELKKREAEDVQELRKQFASAGDAVKVLQVRLDGAEERNRAIFSELRLGIFNLEHPGAAEAKFVPPDETAAMDSFAPPRQPERARSGEMGGRMYLSSARRAALDAAAASALREDEPGIRALLKKRVEVSALALLVVVGMGAGAWRLMPEHEAVPVRAAATAQLPSRPAVVKDRLTALAEAGNAKAELILGIRLVNGTGVRADMPRGVRLIEDAARRGEPIAQNYMGVLCQTGKGVGKNMAGALRWFEAAALQGNLKAMANLGKLYAGGWKEGVNYDEAARWFIRAAGFGDTDSAFNLAVLYELGDGVPYSLFDAYKWYAIAGAEGDKSAADRADIIADLMMPGDVKTAGLLAKKFVPSQSNRAANEMPAFDASAATRG
jgi:TPR repeat protein